MTTPTPALTPESSIPAQTRRMLLEPNAREDDWAALHGVPPASPESSYGMDRCEMDEQRAWKARRR